MIIRGQDLAPVVGDRHRLTRTNARVPDLASHRPDVEHMSRLKLLVGFRSFRRQPLLGGYLQSWAIVPPGRKA